MALPTAEVVLALLDALETAGYSLQARLSASDWATPINVHEDVDAIEPPALGDAIFLLGVADVRDRSNIYVYGPSDYRRVAELLRRA